VSFYDNLYRFTGKGLPLMTANIFRISGELLPGLFHENAWSLSAQALSISGGYSDIYAARQTGFAMPAKETIDYPVSKGKKVSLITAHLYRPYSIRRLMDKIPASVKKIALLDLAKGPGNRENL